MNRMIKIKTTINYTNPAEPAKNLSDDEITELLDHNRVAYQAALKAMQYLKEEITILGREQARREGIMFPPSFEAILTPHNRRAA